jgi:hypothetical protein
MPSGRSPGAAPRSPADRHCRKVRCECGARTARGILDPRVYVGPDRNWGGETAFRRQVHYVITDRLEPSLKAAGSALEHTHKAQAYIRGVENFPDFMEV